MVIGNQIGFGLNTADLVMELAINFCNSYIPSGRYQIIHFWKRFFRDSACKKLLLLHDDGRVSSAKEWNRRRLLTNIAAAVDFKTSPGIPKWNRHKTQAFFCAESIPFLAKKMRDKAVLAFWKRVSAFWKWVSAFWQGYVFFQWS